MLSFGLFTSTKMDYQLPEVLVRLYKYPKKRPFWLSPGLVREGRYTKLQPWKLTRRASSFGPVDSRNIQPGGEVRGCRTAAALPCFW
jgi:hypothetical protein